MRYIFALILLLPAGLSLADTENRVAISEERVQSELTVLYKKESLLTTSHIYHYCHMNSVYFSRSSSHNTRDAWSIIWNYEKGDPLRCSDYNKYILKLAAENLDN